MSRQKFRIGDIVRVENDESVFIVSDVIEWILNTEDGEIELEYECELIQIHPITINLMYKSEYQDNMILYAKRFSLHNANLLEYIQKERESKGLIGKPSYIEICEENMKQEKHSMLDKIFNRKPSKVVAYSHIETIDDCLDAMNDLSEMYKMWQDDRYLKDREVVLERLKELT